MPGRYQRQYDTQYRPALPIIEGLVLRQRTGEWSRTVRAIVDSGADQSMVPFGVIESIRPPDKLRNVTVIDAFGRPLEVEAIRLEFEIPGIHLPESRAVFLITEGTEVIVGRDILNLLRTTMDGILTADQPEPLLTLEAP